MCLSMSSNFLFICKRKRNCFVVGLKISFPLFLSLSILHLFSNPISLAPPDIYHHMATARETLKEISIVIHSLGGRMSGYYCIYGVVQLLFVQLFRGWFNDISSYFYRNYLPLPRLSEGAEQQKEEESNLHGSSSVPYR